MAMDIVRIVGVHCRVRPPLFSLLLLHEDKNVGLLPNTLLFLLHDNILRLPRHHVWHARVHWMRYIRSSYLSQHQIRLMLEAAQAYVNVSLGLHDTDVVFCQKCCSASRQGGPGGCSDITL